MPPLRLSVVAWRGACNGWPSQGGSLGRAAERTRDEVRNVSLHARIPADLMCRIAVFDGDGWAALGASFGLPSPRPIPSLSGMTADDIIAQLKLQPHPEGGHYRQTWVAENGGRPTGTCIYFLLKEGETSHWHRVDATEIWLYHAGDPLILSLSETDAGPARDHILTPDLSTGAPQLIVPKDHWQAARTTGEFTLVSCTVSPGFHFEGFSLADPGFDIPRSA